MTLADAGVVVSGAAVMLFGSPLPDLIIELVVGGIVVKGGWDILKEAREAQRQFSSAHARKVEPSDSFEGCAQ